ncbi:MAG: flagellin [Parvibaculaceae bacterium]
MQIASYAQSTTMRNSISQIQTQLSDLQRQLTSGLKTDNYAGLGDARSLVLALTGQMQKSNSYLDTIQSTQLRLNSSMNALSSMNDINSELKTGSLSSTFKLTSGGQTDLQITAGMRLSESVDLLNLNVADRQLFGGKDTQTTPVVTSTMMLDGDTTHAGLKTLIAQRNAADLGSDGLGRLALTSPTAGTVNMAEDASPSEFGFKLSNLSSSLGGTTVTGPTGTPASIDVAFSAALPAEGQSVSFDLNLPDGTSTTVKLTATSKSPAGAGEFTIGTDATTTAANFQTALTSSLQTEGKQSLVAASTVQAGNNFFTNPPMRVDGPPYETATATVAGTPDNTVIWYRGDSSGTPGNNFIATVGDGAQISYGARADQGALLTVVKNAALLAAVSYTGTDTTNETQAYAQLTKRTASALNHNDGSQTLENVMTDMGLKSSTLATAQTKLNTQISTSKSVLADTQNADPYDVATKLTSLITQLQASYQVTSSLSQLSLVKYL